MENINEEINRISELMGINEAPPKKKVASSTTKKAVSKSASQARQSSVQKTAKKKKTATSSVTPSVAKKTAFDKIKKKILGNTELDKAMVEVFGTSRAAKAKKLFNDMPAERLKKYLVKYENKEKLADDIYKQMRLLMDNNPLWWSKWKYRIKDNRVLKYILYLGVTVGSLGVYALISERGWDGFFKYLGDVINSVDTKLKSTAEEDWKSYTENLDNYKVEDENGVFVGTLKDVLKRNQTLDSPIYTKTTELVDEWWNKNQDSYPTEQTMYPAMESIVNYIIGDIDREFNSSLWVNPMKENDPNRKTLKNKGQEYWDKLNTIVDSAKNKIPK